MFHLTCGKITLFPLFYLGLLLLLCLPSNGTAAGNPDPLRLEKYIHRFDWQDAKNSYPADATLFIGSSSIYKWKTAAAFPTENIINRGIPGAQISDLTHYYPTLIKRYRPRKIVFYCGDNDIAAGKTPRQVLSDFTAFTRQLHNEPRETTLFFLAIKPSLLRWNVWPKMASANRLIKDFCLSHRRCVFIDTATPLLNRQNTPAPHLFRDNGLHLNNDGYAIWEKLLREKLTE